MPIPEITFELLEDGIGHIALNRPEKRNALNAAMKEEILRLLTSDVVADLRALVLTGEGTSFCAGVDLKEVRSAPQRDSGITAELFSQFRRVQPTVIAAVQGYALGAGSGLAMAADMVVAADDAVFGYPEVDHGLVAAVTLVRLQELVSSRRAYELVITGRRVPAVEAVALGMVNEIVPAEQVRPRALDLARQVAALAPFTLRTAKQFFYESLDLSYDSGVRAAGRVIELVRQSKEAQQGMAAFGRDRVSARGEER